MSESKMNIELYDQMVDNLVKPGAEILLTLTPERVDLWHMGTGIAGEAGEVSEAIKKHIINNTSLSYTGVVKELGDLEFYVSKIYRLLGIDRDYVREQNMGKLVGPGGRFASGKYSDAQAQARADKQ